MMRPYRICLLALLPAMLLACHGADKADKKEGGEDEKVAAQGTPVTLTSVGNDTLSDFAEVNATATFLQKHYVKANVNGYVQSVNAAPGKYVTAGEVLFTVKTKEAMSIGNAVNKLDTSFRFTGVNQIRAGGAGYIAQLNHQDGDYVQDGEQLAAISDESSFVFILNLPYELRQYVKIGGVVPLTLPDGAVLQGRVASELPAVDPSAQTQSIVLRVSAGRTIPENLIARARIVKAFKPDAISLPKAALLTNDVQSDFWVMKMIDSTTAVKVPVKKGMETADRVEILEPKFTPADKIVLTGNFGLPDTAKVAVTN